MDLLHWVYQLAPLLLLKYILKLYFQSGFKYTCPTGGMGRQQSPLNSTPPFLISLFYFTMKLLKRNALSSSPLTRLPAYSLWPWHSSLHWRSSEKSPTSAPCWKNLILVALLLRLNNVGCALLTHPLSFLGSLGLCSLQNVQHSAGTRNIT